MRKIIANVLAVSLIMSSGLSWVPQGLSQNRGSFGHDFSGLEFSGLGGIPDEFCRLKNGNKAPKPWKTDWRISNDRIPDVPKQKPAKMAGPKPNSKLEGNVLDEVGRPAKDVEVHLLGLDAPREFAACTDAKGRYSLKELQAGDYMACVLYKGKVGLCRKFALLHGQKEKNDFRLASFTETGLDSLLKQLPPGGSAGVSSLFARLEGTVFDGYSPAMGLEIHLKNVDAPYDFTVSTDSRGRYSLKAIPGTYMVCVLNKGKTGLCREGTLRRGRILISDFDLEYFQ